MAKYYSSFEGEQIDEVVGLFIDRGLSSVVGIVQRNQDGSYSNKTISWNDIQNKPTPTELGAIPTSMLETAITASDEKIPTSKAVKTYVDNNCISDVTVDGVSVVSSNVAEIDLSDKQDTLIPGTGITIVNNVISVDLSAFE